MPVAWLALAGCSSAPPTEADRRSIDDLLALMRARLEHAAHAALDSWSARGAADDGAAAADLVDAAVNRSLEFTLPPELVREFFTAQVAAASFVRTALHTRWQAQPESRPRARDAASVPPRAPAATDMLEALAKAYPVLRRAGGKDLLLERADKLLGGLPGAGKTMVLALAPLASVAN